ncbi:hypothetical protein G4B88_011106 [Cannabis sativa]|uniref:Uncharacterized protein n=1 Tax=Cannabis sativa TaxID=3483 RepID=A0A7J6DMF3_CANSA|nr:hypothetical protein G4B88_025159 [Cannabis sativa]KAF4347689.1 hypothetical protein G4B88_011106 [Cannabis sativa]
MSESFIHPNAELNQALIGWKLAMASKNRILKREFNGLKKKHSSPTMSSVTYVERNNIVN